MNSVLEEQLWSSFPFMKKKLSLAEQHFRGFVSDLYSAFGCECGDGWYKVLYDMCAEITDVFAAVGLQPDIVVDQVKEKYGSLRFHYHHEPAKGTSTPKALRQEISRLVDEAEERSKRVCEECGNPGHLRLDLDWIQTLCDRCYAKKIKQPL